MKKIVIVAMILMLFGAVDCSKTAESEDVKRESGKLGPLDTVKKKTSYAVGYDMGKRFKRIFSEVDLSYFVEGVRDAVAENQSPIGEEESRKIINEFLQKVNKLEQERRAKLGEKNKVEGEAFLEENAKKEGIKVTESGLQYRVITEGNGPIPKITDRVKVQYRGTFIDGKEFDSSFKRGKPAVFSLKRVIRGWTEAMQLMKVGSKYQVFVPSEIGYGKAGMGNVIGPNAVLIFEIELLGIEPPLKKPEPHRTQKK